jgi:hypothetical protein
MCDSAAFGLAACAQTPKTWLRSCRRAPELRLASPEAVITRNGRSPHPLTAHVIGGTLRDVFPAYFSQDLRHTPNGVVQDVHL